MKSANSRLRLTVALVVAAAAMAPRAVRAQSAAAQAEVLFHQGQKLMDKGEYAQACERFEASDRLDPAIGAELNLGLCRLRNHQYASALAAYLQAETTAKQHGDARAAVARKNVLWLTPRVLTLTIAVPTRAPVDGLVIKRNATVVDAATWNQPIPVDPDEYTITAEAPGYQPWSTSVVVKLRSKTVEVPLLDKLPAPPAEPRREVRSAAAGSDEPSGARDPGAGGAEAGAAPSRWTGKRKLSVVFAAVGVAAVGAGVGLGLHASTLERKTDGLCDATTCKTRQAADDSRSAQHYALAADIGFAAGGVAVVGAAALWLLGAPSSRDTIAIIPTLDATHVGISFARSF